MTNGNDPINAITDLNAGPPTPGLTKREYFAALAMQGLVVTAMGENGFVDVRRPVYDKNGESVFDEDGRQILEVMETAESLYADCAVLQADALIDRLNKEVE